MKILHFLNSCGFLCLFVCSVALGAEPTSGQIAAEQRVAEQTVAEQGRPSTIRIRGFQESMLPSLGAGTRFVPKSTGDGLIPAFTLSQLGMDEEFAPGWRGFYLQKFRVIWNSVGENAILPQLFDPRFGIRKTRLFGDSDWQSELDFFIHPGLNRTILIQSQRLLDLGVRMTNRYSIPGTRLTVGGNFELVSTLYRADSRDADWSGVLSVMASYRLSPVIATQSWIYGFYKHKKGDSMDQFFWDITDLPFFQNGLSFDLSKNLTVSVMHNQYLGVVPHLNNMWMSLWLTMSLG